MDKETKQEAIMTVSSSGVDQQRVIALSDKEVTALSAGDINQFLAIFDDDAVLMPPTFQRRPGMHCATGCETSWNVSR